MDNPRGGAEGAPYRGFRSEAPGLDTRRFAADLIESVLLQRRSLDEGLDSERGHAVLRHMAERDRALTRLLATTVLRRLGSLRALLATYLDRGPPKDAPRAETALLLGAAQICLLDMPAHAAVDLSVRLASHDRKARHFTGLVNAVLRRVATDGAARLADLDAPMLDTPAWLMARWRRTYGEATARAIAEANAREPALDLTVRSDPEAWAARLGGRVLPTGSVRLAAKGLVSHLPGYDEGGWWVQDAAAALPARLLGDVRGLRVADLCAAPGGKTAQLAAAGAEVVAVDRADGRLGRLRSNLARLGLEAHTLALDVLDMPDDRYDAILLDAPCTATGTIRRHPDVAWLKTPEDLAALADLQAALLGKAVSLLKPGGRLVYCTCSLEPEEGVAQIERALVRFPGLRRLPARPGEAGIDPSWIGAEGDLRTLPCHLPTADGRLSGLDGFFAACLTTA